MPSPNSYVYSAPNLGIPSIISDSSDSAAFRLFIYQKKIRLLSLWTVSYTHLDVYKRQDQPFVAEFLFENAFMEL